MPQHYEKQRRLESILHSLERGAKAIVFCSTKRMCDQLCRSLDRSFGALSIHGDKSQQERDYVLAQFRSGAACTLIATDVAARGLDVKDIRCVVNYDFPTGVEDYVHRIGRTGRAGATGVAYSFISQQDAKHARELIKVLEGAQQVVPPALQQLAMSAPMGKGPSRWGGGGGGGGVRGGMGYGQSSYGMSGSQNGSAGGSRYGSESGGWRSNGSSGGGGDRWGGGGRGSPDRRDRDSRDRSRGWRDDRSPVTRGRRSISRSRSRSPRR